VGEPLQEPIFKIDSNKIIFRLNSPQHVRLRILDSLGQELSNLFDVVKPTGKYAIAIPKSKIADGSFIINFATDSAAYVMNLNDGRQSGIAQNMAVRETRRDIVEKVLDDLSAKNQIPIDKRINFDVLDSVVTATIAEKGIQMPVAYGIMSASRDSIALAKPAKYQNEIFRSQYRARLFPHDLFVEKNDLVLAFPQEQMYLFKKVGLWAIIILLFISIIIFSFVYVIRTIFKQKQFSKLLIDFINNMTHEFKTPISTISLASETISNPQIIRDEDRLKKYGQIIRDESLRMRNQVEKILELASLEEGDFELNKSHVNIHELIDNAVANFSLKIKNSNGEIRTDLKANDFLVEGDAVHLENIINNLIDNAVKYANKNPQIFIKTENMDQRVKISVKDNGIGLKPEDQKRVFDKYYRVPTGNVHDVKGFGLGLSYVKLIVEAHGGKVGLKSEIDQGSIFEVYLPMKQN
jgi:two-component system phosphate regulon sensor histidine kinase PhoR